MNETGKSETHPRGALVVRLCNWVGEVVLSVPAIRRLSAAGYAVHLYGKPWAPQLLESLALPVTVRESDGRLAVKQLRALRSRLAREFPAAAPRALLLTRSFSSAMEARIAGLKAAGFAYDGRSMLLSEAYKRPEAMHAGEEYWQVVSEFLGPPHPPFPSELGLECTQGQLARARQLLADANVAPGSYVLFCPFSGSDDRESRKIWPGFPALMDRLKSRGHPVIVCPGPGEEVLAQTRAPGAVLLPNVDLGTYGALLSLARTVVANDTGPGHLAAAVGARVISIYGPDSSVSWSPVGRRVSFFHDRRGWPAVDTIHQAITT